MAVQYRRDAPAVHQALYPESDGSVTTRVDCTIQVPERYLERHLASVGSEIFIVGIFAVILDDGRYGVSMANAMLRITPHSTNTQEIAGENYLVFSFAAGDRVLAATDLVVENTLTYYIYEEFVAKGRIPWYLRYDDLTRVFDTAKYHAGMNLGNHAIIDLIFSTIARKPGELMVLFKHTLKTQEDVRHKFPTYVPFRSVIYNTPNTTAKLIGAYFTDAVTSALVNPSTRTEHIEELLRK